MTTIGNHASLLSLLAGALLAVPAWSSGEESGASEKASSAEVGEAEHAAEHPEEDGWRLSLGLPVEVQALGLAGGIRPELLVQPFGADTATHLRFAVGIQGNAQYGFTPIDLGARWVWRPLSWLQPQVGVGLENQIFWLFDAPTVWRPAAYVELGVGAQIVDGWSVHAQVVPSFVVWGFPAPSLSARVGVVYRLPG